MDEVSNRGCSRGGKVGCRRRGRGRGGRDKGSCVAASHLAPAASEKERTAFRMDGRGDEIESNRDASDQAAPTEEVRI